MITNVQAAFEDIRNNSDNNIHNLYSKTSTMAERVRKTPNTKPLNPAWLVDRT